MESAENQAAPGSAPGAPAPGSTPAPPVESNGEAALIAALRDGDDAAYETMVRDNIGRMMAVSKRILRSADDAADAVQDAFMQAFRKIDTFQGNAKLSTWLHQIVVNASLMKLRKARRRNERNIEDLLPAWADSGHAVAPGPTWTRTADDILATEEDRKLVRDLIDELPDDYRTVLLLRDIEQLDTAETAEALGIKPGAVKTRLHRARQALKTLLEPHMAPESDGPRDPWL